MSTETRQYGSFYWCIKTKLSKSSEIYAMADRADVRPDGTLVLLQFKEGGAAIHQPRAGTRPMDRGLRRVRVGRQRPCC
jgi:hypothetical protein